MRVQWKSRSVSFENVIVQVEPKFIFQTQQFYSGLLSVCLIASALPSEFHFSSFPVLSTTLFFIFQINWILFVIILRVVFGKISSKYGKNKIDAAR